MSNYYGGGCDGGGCSDNNNGCNPCSQVASQESLGSKTDNLILTLLGAVTKSLSPSGAWVWNTPCSVNNQGLSCNPVQTGEGLICYMLRILGSLGFFWGGSYSSGTSYCPNTVVTYGTNLYLALQTAQGHQPDVSPTYWTLFLAGVQGPPGPAGPAGSGSAINYAVTNITGNYTAANSDAIILASPAGATVVTLPLMSGLLTGKWFCIKNLTGSYNVTVTPTTDTINGASTFVLSQPGESIYIVANNGDWRII